jgi:hypothetical protein
VEGFGDLAILDGLNIDRHDLEAFARVGTPKRSPAGVPDTSPRTITAICAATGI